MKIFSSIIVITIILFGIGKILYGHNSITMSSAQKDLTISTILVNQPPLLSVASPAWVIIDTLSNVIVSYQISDCQGENKLYLKIENNSNTAVTVNWSFWGATVFKSLALNANETKTGECNINSPIELDEIIPSGKTIADLVSNIIVN